MRCLAVYAVCLLAFSCSEGKFEESGRTQASLVEAVSGDWVGSCATLTDFTGATVRDLLVTLSFSGEKTMTETTEYFDSNDGIRIRTMV